jgi:hypothetical protein
MAEPPPVSPVETTPPSGPRAEVRREVVQGDALVYLDKQVAHSGTSIFTSLPDVSETPDLGFAAWRTFFVDTARTVIRWVPQDGVSLFYQSDIVREGALVDKGYLISRAAELEEASVVFHKIVCRAPPGTAAYGRPTFSHLLAVTRGKPQQPRQPLPDVLTDAGVMSWSKATGVAACRLGCRYLREATETRIVVDPFCGRGTMLAVANAFGFDAIGVEQNSRRARAARAFRLPRDEDSTTREG